jgi:hypothetical protein
MYLKNVVGFLPQDGAWPTIDGRLRLGSEDRRNGRFWHSIDRSDRAGRSFLGHPRFAQAVPKPLSKGQIFWIARYG